MKVLLRGTGNKSNRTVEVPLPIPEDSYETVNKHGGIRT